MHLGDFLQIEPSDVSFSADIVAGIL